MNHQNKSLSQIILFLLAGLCLAYFLSFSVTIANTQAINVNTSFILVNKVLNIAFNFVLANFFYIVVFYYVKNYQKYMFLFIILCAFVLLLANQTNYVDINLKNKGDLLYNVVLVLYNILFITLLGYVINKNYLDEFMLILLIMVFLAIRLYFSNFDISAPFISMLILNLTAIFVFSKYFYILAKPLIKKLENTWNNNLKEY